jgi:hypothetical protein
VTEPHFVAMATSVSMFSERYDLRLKNDLSFKHTFACFAWLQRPLRDRHVASAVNKRRDLNG